MLNSCLSHLSSQKTGMRCIFPRQEMGGFDKKETKWPQLKQLWAFPGSSAGKESAHNMADLGSIPGLERSPGGGNGNPLQFLPGESHGQRSLVDYSPWDQEELDTTEVAKCTCTYMNVLNANQVYI